MVTLERNQPALPAVPAMLAVVTGAVASISVRLAYVCEIVNPARPSV